MDAENARQIEFEKLQKQRQELIEWLNLLITTQNINLPLSYDKPEHATGYWRIRHSRNGDLVLILIFSGFTGFVSALSISSTFVLIANCSRQRKNNIIVRIRYGSLSEPMLILSLQLQGY